MANDLSDLRVLVVDDEPDVRAGLVKLAAGTGARVQGAATGEEALELLDRDGADLVLTDLRMPGISGAQLLSEVKRRSPATAVVLITGFGTIETAVRCLEHGAAHFVTKPFDNDEVVGLVTRLGRKLLAERGQDKAGGASGPRPYIAEDPRSRRVLELAREVAPAGVTVLIEGETGTGKEVLALTIHKSSLRADRPFVALNCAAVPDALLESELFGHGRGAFTGADRGRKGIFQQASGGTVFLDEVAAMSLPFQSKLLRVLAERTVRPLGEEKDVPVDFRLIAATNRDLSAMVAAGEFREDLYYRLRVVSLRIPPLRERPADVPALAVHFLRRAAAEFLPAGTPAPEIAASALEELCSHAWPGNVRELENVMQHAVVVCHGRQVLPHHLGLELPAWSPPETGAAASAEDLRYEDAKQAALERFQRSYVERVLERTGGNVTRAAEACGLSRAALQRIMRALGIERESFEGEQGGD